jgi:hypothetical protein
MLDINGCNCCLWARVRIAIRGHVTLGRKWPTEDPWAQQPHLFNTAYIFVETAVVSTCKVPVLAVHASVVAQKPVALCDARVQHILAS